MRNCGSGDWCAAPPDVALTPDDQPLTRMEPHLRAIAEHIAGIERGFADTGRRLQATIGTIVGDEGREERKGTMKRTRAPGPRRRSGSAAFSTRQETIAVRGAAAETLTIRATRHGPVLSDALPPGSVVLR